MIKSATVKGYIYALIATLAFSNVYIFSKAALNEVHLSQFGLYWFAISCLLNLLLVMKNKKLGILFSMNKKGLSILLLLGIMEIITTSTFFISINIIPDPSITSFLGNLYPVMLVIMGVAVLNERFGKIESIGVVLALTGAFAISYQGGNNWRDFFIPGTGVVLINAFFAATTSIIAKKNINLFSPELISFNRTFWLLLFSFGVFIYFGKPLAIPAQALKNIVIGAILGPFLALYTVYMSFKYIEASRSSIIQSMKGIFVLVGAYLYLGTIPTGFQLMGGLLTVVGVSIVALAQAGILRFSKMKN